MLTLVLIVTFIFCLAMAVASLLISHQFTSTYASEFHKHYFYYLVAFYAFAFYGVWGQILTRGLLSSIDTDAAVIEAVAGFLPVLGVPFAFVAWLMLISMAHSMFGQAVKSAWAWLHAAVFGLLLLGSWVAATLLQAGPEGSAVSLGLIEAVAMIGVELLYFSAFVVLAVRFSAGCEAVKGRVLLRFSVFLFAAFAARSLLAGLVLVDVRLSPIALLGYFASSLAPVLYLRANADRAFEPVRAEHASNQGMEQIFERYGVTKREREVVRKICLGKTNQQIADELFISLQTVKDHTHRIYSKAGVKSRIQLVQLMNTAQ